MSPSLLAARSRSLSAVSSTRGAVRAPAVGRCCRCRRRRRHRRRPKLVVLLQPCFATLFSLGRNACIYLQFYFDSLPPTFARVCLVEENFPGLRFM